MIGPESLCRTHPMKTIRNRLSAASYQRGQSVVAGLVLAGVEVRAIRDGKASLIGSHVRVDGGELWLVNLQLRLKDEISDQNRHKLLVTASQLRRLEIEAKGPGQTILPLELQLGRYIKVLIAPAKGRQKADKRQAIKRKDQDREIARRLRGRGR